MRQACSAAICVLKAFNKRSLSTPRDRSWRVLLSYLLNINGGLNHRWALVSEIWVCLLCDQTKSSRLNMLWVHMREKKKKRLPEVITPAWFFHWRHEKTMTRTVTVPVACMRPTGSWVNPTLTWDEKLEGEAVLAGCQDACKRGCFSQLLVTDHKC